MKILSIGNSFSEDAQRYLHRLAKTDGEDIYTVNLYIGGCSLEKHVSNLKSGESAYDLQINGESTGKKISIIEAVNSEKWDYITLQQASHLSADFNTYIPYIEILADFLRKTAPHSKILLHETWAYENGSEKLKAVAKFGSAKEMFSAVDNSYEKAAALIKADGIIPSGKAMLILSEDYGLKVHRDTFHASYGLGRYLLALTWYKFLTDKDISKNNFNDFDEEVLLKDKKAAIKAVNDIFKE